jgi:hypothetical protein
MSEPSPTSALAQPPLDEATWTRSTLTRALARGCFALAVGAGLGYLIAHEPTPRDPREEQRKQQEQQAVTHEDSHPDRPPPAGEAELALLAPLKEGGTLGGYTVREIDAVGDSGQLRLVCQKENAVVELNVALKAESGPEPPATAGRYAVYYFARSAPPADGDALAHALAKIIEANSWARVPRKLRPFVPEGH